MGLNGKYQALGLFLGPLDLLPWHVVGPSVRLHYNSVTYVGIFFKLGGNIPWVNISSFFEFLKN